MSLHNIWVESFARRTGLLPKATSHDSSFASIWKCLSCFSAVCCYPCVYSLSDNFRWFILELCFRPILNASTIGKELMQVWKLQLVFIDVSGSLIVHGRWAKLRIAVLKIFKCIEDWFNLTGATYHNCSFQLLFVYKTGNRCSFWHVSDFFANWQWWNCALSNWW